MKQRLLPKIICKAFDFTAAHWNSIKYPIFRFGKMFAKKAIKFPNYFTKTFASLPNLQEFHGYSNQSLIVGVKTNITQFFFRGCRQYQHETIANMKHWKMTNRIANAL